jgi:hypothetical protein
MDNTRTTLCASCRKFPREALEKDGIGMCPDYNIERRWNDPATVLYLPAKDRDYRRELVKKLMETKKEEA